MMSAAASKESNAPGDDRNIDSKPVLGFDFGRRRIGVAVGQRITATATALETLAATDGQPDWSHIEELIEQWQPAMLVVGEPTHMDGAEHDMTTAARRFGRQLQGRLGLPTVMIDERLTSVEAERGMTARQRAATSIDSLAAKLILEAWLEGAG